CRSEVTTPSSSSTLQFPEIAALADAVLLVVVHTLTTNVLPSMEMFFQNIEIIFKDMFQQPQ
ncbi:hypothetical protein Tco_0022821, partial [Tanacetum coccineum]